MTQLKLALLEPHDDALQKCVYCPKLSRAACPVANVEANETVTPWGKMSLAYFAARGDVPVDAEHADSAWACSACFACRERCEHKNPVATVLDDARAEYFRAGVAPAAARELARDWPAREGRHREALGQLAKRTSMTMASEGARHVLMVGCSYARHSPAVAESAVRVARRFVSDLQLSPSCCGLPLLHAGDREGFLQAATSLAPTLAQAERVVVVDPGCARCVRDEYARLGVAEIVVEPLVDVIYANLDAVPARALEGRKLRYHDPCQLGRGLGRYEEPRAILARLTGQPAAELERCRAQAECSGGGGLLPITRPDTSATMADERLQEHRTLGGGTLVTACGNSLRRMSSRASDTTVVDLVTLVDEAMDESTP